MQPRFQSWGSNSLVYGITTLLQKKIIDRSTQFGAVGYIITLYSSKSYVKSWGVHPDFGEVRTPRGCTHDNCTYGYGQFQNLTLTFWVSRHNLTQLPSILSQLTPWNRVFLYDSLNWSIMVGPSRVTWCAKYAMLPWQHGVNHMIMRCVDFWFDRNIRQISMYSMLLRHGWRHKFVAFIS